MAGGRVAANRWECRTSDRYPVIAEALRSKGLVILEHCVVRGLERSAGAVSVVITEKGEVRCKAAVLAGRPGRICFYSIWK